MQQAVVNIPIPTRETQGNPHRSEDVLIPLDPSEMSEADIWASAVQMKAVIDHGRNHPLFGRFVTEQSLQELVWIVRNGWALVANDNAGVVVGCAYFKLLGWTTDGLGQRFPVFKFGGVVMRDQGMYRRYMFAALSPYFRRCVVLARTHRSFGSWLERMRFVRYYRRELQRKYRGLYRQYFGGRQPNDERDFFVQFPDKYVHPRAWQVPDRPCIYSKGDYKVPGSGGAP